MRETMLALALIFLVGCANEAVTPISRPRPLREPRPYPKPIPKNIKELMQGHVVLEVVGPSTHGPMGDSWSFISDGTFYAGAVTGSDSWRASGKWSELPDGSIALRGIQKNARFPDREYPPYRRIIKGFTLVEENDGALFVRFTANDKRVEQKNSPDKE